MNHALYILTTAVHVISATIWVGSLIFMSLILVPALRSMRDPPLMSRLIQGVGRRYKRVGWISLALLLISGVMSLHFRGITWAMLTGREFWETPFGETLYWKLFLFILVLLLSVLHDAVIGPGSRNAARGNEFERNAARYRKAATWMGRLTLVLSVIIVILGVMLVRGRPW